MKKPKHHYLLESIVLVTTVLSSEPSLAFAPKEDRHYLHSLPISSLRQSSSSSDHDPSYRETVFHRLPGKWYPTERSVYDEEKITQASGGTAALRREAEKFKNGATKLRILMEHKEAIVDEILTRLEGIVVKPLKHKSELIEALIDSVKSGIEHYKLPALLGDATEARDMDLGAEMLSAQTLSLFLSRLRGPKENLDDNKIQQITSLLEKKIKDVLQSL
jgi:hypothetical protein